MNTAAQLQGYTDGASVYRMRVPGCRDYAIGWIESLDDKLNPLLDAANEFGEQV